MVIISDAAKKVPMMFRAQVNGRCQLQRLIRDEEPHALRWVNEWTQETYPQPPVFGSEVKTRVATLTWRFVTNSGQDDGVIRPVIGAKGYPFYPGSSMKGIFRQACTPEQADRYCGEDLARAGFKPGILRFHGGYPVDRQWTEQLVDIVHPQQNWQVKTGEKSAAFVQISLYQPTLQFGISSTEDLAETEWDIVWDIWQRALSTGIGCRVSAGYGQPQKRTGEVLYRTQLKGQGQAAKLIDGTGEFRPNVFRAAIRGHALRLFGGLTDETTADRLVEQLFGGVQGKGTVGLLSMGFRSAQLELEQFGKGSYAQPTYQVEGELNWLLTRSLPAPEQESLRKLIAALTRFAMVLGGFGKSWRRADHRLFLEDYYDQDNPLIGCHWEWLGERALVNDVRVRKLDKVGEWITETRQIVQDWMLLQGEKPKEQRATWREAWHPETVEVWGRMASDREDSLAIHWLHGAYREAIPTARIREGSIYQTSVTGQMGKIGRLWHRMYPLVRLKPPETQGGKPIPKPTSQFIELLTIFPDHSPAAIDFLDFLDSQHHQPKGFQKLW